MRFAESTPVPDSCLFSLVETSFQSAVKLYQFECKRLDRKARKVSWYHSDLRTDGCTWILCSDDYSLLACADPLHDHVSLDTYPVAGGSLPDDTTEIRQPYRDKPDAKEFEERMAQIRKKQTD